MNLTNRILVAMVAGIALGSIFNVVLNSGGVSESASAILNAYLIDGLFDVVGQIFVASLKLLVVPLVLVSLICGSSALGDSARMGPIAGKTIGFYLFTTGLAVSVALIVATAIGPGQGLSLVTDTEFTAKAAPALKDVIVNIFPTNPVKAMAEANMLQIIVFALLFGYAMSHAGEPGQRLAGFFRDAEAVVMRMVAILMEFAPYGVFALLARLFSSMGLGAILDLAGYFFTLAGLLVFHGFVVYPTLLRLFGGVSPASLLQKMRPVWAFAFSTSSSGATIPVTLRTVEKRLGVQNSVAGFTVPLGATINMDGTAIMQGVATIFIAQVYGVDLSAGALFGVVLTAILASIGTAGVPGVGLITLALVLEQAGLPVEGIALIIGVDRLLDMLRTVINVTGDAVASVVVAKSEGQLDMDVYCATAAQLDECEVRAS
jgi:Na+/H+-dicarboxylate symporter